MTATLFSALTISQQEYSNIIITAVEGGSNYWASFRDYRHHVDGEEVAATVSVRDREEPTEQRKTVTIKEIASAFSRLARGEAGEALAHQRPKWAKAYREIADGNWDYDATDADILMQVAVYGTVHFG